MAEKNEVFDPDALSVGKAPVQESSAIPAAASFGMTNLQRIKRIERVLDSIRPQLKRDGGDVELVEVEGNTIFVNTVGTCTNCRMASMTIGGIHRSC